MSGVLQALMVQRRHWLIKHDSPIVIVGADFCKEERQGHRTLFTFTEHMAHMGVTRGTTKTQVQKCSSAVTATVKLQGYVVAA